MEYSNINNLKLEDAIEFYKKESKKSLSEDISSYYIKLSGWLEELKEYRDKNK